MHGAQAIDQHRARPALDPHAHLAVHRGERKARAQKCVGAGFIAITGHLGAAALLESQGLIGKVVILPQDLGGTHPDVCGQIRCQIANEH
jgi:hypothetical protein